MGPPRLLASVPLLGLASTVGTSPIVLRSRPFRLVSPQERASGEWPIGPTFNRLAEANDNQAKGLR